MAHDDSPYAPGQSHPLPGSSGRTLADPVPLEVGPVIQRAWEVFKEHPGTVIGGALITVVPSVIVGVLNVGLGVAGEQAGGDLREMLSVVQLGNQLVSYLLTLFLQLGLIRITINLVRGHDATVGMVLSEGARYLSALGAAILVTIVVLFGLLLLLVPGIIAGIGLQFALYLVVDRRVGPIDGLTQSWRLTDGSKLTLVGINLVIGLGAMAATCVTCGFGYVVVLPVILLAQAVMYHSLLHANPEFDPGRG